MQLLQERDFGQKVNAVFEFLKLNFVPLMTAMLYITGPISIIAGMALGVYQSSMLSVLGATETASGGNPFLGDIFSTLTPVYFVYIFLFIIASIFASLTVYGYVLEYEERGGNVPTITPSDVWARVKENILSYIGYSILLFVIVIFATCFLIIPGVYVSVPLSLIYMVLMREKLGFSQAMSRCFYLVTDKWWSTFGLIVVMSVIQAIVAYIFQIPTLIFYVLKMLHILESGSTIVSTISGVIATIGGILVSSILNLSIVFQYYNLLERREGLGIMNAIGSIGSVQAPRTDLREEEF